MTEAGRGDTRRTRPEYPELLLLHHRGGEGFHARLDPLALLGLHVGLHVQGGPLFPFVLHGQQVLPCGDDLSRVLEDFQHPSPGGAADHRLPLQPLLQGGELLLRRQEAHPHVDLLAAPLEVESAAVMGTRASSSR